MTEVCQSTGNMRDAGGTDSDTGHIICVVFCC